MIVTDIKWKTEKGVEKVGFYMDAIEKENYDGIPKHLSKGWDVVGIVSGHGKTRIGKSVKAFQIAMYIAWLLAGGKQVTEFDKEKKVYRTVKIIPPKKPVHFNLYENVVFKPEDLVSQATKLFDKYGYEQVLVYDEGREGLDAKVMTNINEIMEDFFQKCGMMRFFILIVLPNFFKLHEDYAVARSVFLVDCYHDKNMNRGFFSFFNERQKEWLYFLGKKRLGISQKYSAARETFYGRFTRWFPFNQDEYNELKLKSLKRKGVGLRYSYMKKQRDAVIYLLKQVGAITEDEISEKVHNISGIKLSQAQISAILNEVNRKMTEMPQEQ